MQIFVILDDENFLILANFYHKNDLFSAVAAILVILVAHGMGVTSEKNGKSYRNSEKFQFA